MNRNLSTDDLVHLVTGITFFGLMFVLFYKLTQGQWPTRDEIGLTGLALLGGSTFILAAAWLLGDDDKGDLL